MNRCGCGRHTSGFWRTSSSTFAARSPSAAAPEGNVVRRPSGRSGIDKPAYRELLDTNRTTVGDWSLAVPIAAPRRSRIEREFFSSSGTELASECRARWNVCATNSHGAAIAARIWQPIEVPTSRQHSGYSRKKMHKHSPVRRPHCTVRALHPFPAKLCRATPCCGHTLWAVKTKAHSIFSTVTSTSALPATQRRLPRRCRAGRLQEHWHRDLPCSPCMISNQPSPVRACAPYRTYRRRAPALASTGIGVELLDMAKLRLRQLLLPPRRSPS